MRALFSILLVLMLPFAALAQVSADTVPGEFQAVVTWIIDGDSIRFKRDGSVSEDECRMLHYNAPEMTGPERAEGKKATRKLISLIKGRRAIIWGLERDRYGRLLCEVRLMDGSYINDIMRDFLRDYKKRDIYLWKEREQKQRGPAH
jgi:endonuclease YncB( thermonuclease family)